MKRNVLKTWRSRTAIGAAVALGLTLTAFADDHDRVRELRGAGAIVPLERITEQVRKLDIEHILEVELESDRQGGHYYEVEVVDDAGEVRKLRYDAATGAPLGESVNDD